MQRRVHSGIGSKLSINVQNANKPVPLQERTNSAALASLSSGLLAPPSPSEAAYTPDTSYTFGVPNPTNRRSHLNDAVIELTSSSDSFPSSGLPSSSAHDSTSPSFSISRSEQTSRRLRRYTQSEQSLILSAQNIARTSTSPQELQIRVLNQAASFLKQQAEDARERSGKLHAILADRNAEPARYQDAQRERWMEEKRQVLMDEESRAIAMKMGSLTLSNISSAPDDLENTEPSTLAETRARQNLLRFLQTTTSRTRTPTRSRASTSLNNVLRERSPRRMTMGDVSPMRLRPWSMTSALMDSVKGHGRSKSHDVLSSAAAAASEPSPSPSLSTAVASTVSPEGLESSGVQSAHPHPPKLAIRSSLSSVPEGQAEEVDTDRLSIWVDSANANPEIETDTPSTALTVLTPLFDPSSSLASDSTSPSASTPTSALEVETPITALTMSTMSLDDKDKDNTHGTATILPYSHIDARAHTTDLSLDAVELPEYAKDLFEGLNRDRRMDLSLSLPTTEVGPSRATTPTPRPIPPSRSSTPNPNPNPSPRKRAHARLSLLKPRPSLAGFTSTTSATITATTHDRSQRNSLLSIPEGEGMDMGMEVKVKRESLTPSMTPTTPTTSPSHTPNTPSFPSESVSVPSSPSPTKASHATSASGSGLDAEGHSTKSPSPQKLKLVGGVGGLRKKLSSRFLGFSGSPTKKRVSTVMTSSNTGSSKV